MNRPSVLEYAHIKEYLRALFCYIQSRRPRFTQASFAKYLGFSPAFLNNVLEGRREISEKKLAKVGLELLEWNAEELSHALTILTIESTPAAEKIFTKVKQQVTARSTFNKRKTVKVEASLSEIGMIQAVLIECIRIPEYSKNPISIANKIGFSEKFVKQVLEELIQAQVLELTENAHYRRVGQPSTIVAAGSSSHLRRFYRQMLDLTIKKIRAENTHSRYIGTETMAFDPELIPEAKAIINRCLDELAMLSGRCKSPTTVFHAGVQFFEVLENIS